MDATSKFLNPATNSLGSAASVPHGMNHTHFDDVSSSEDEDEEERGQGLETGINFETPHVGQPRVRRRIASLNECRIATTVQ